MVYLNLCLEHIPDIERYDKPRGKKYPGCMVAFDSNKVEVYLKNWDGDLPLNYTEIEHSKRYEVHFLSAENRVDSKIDYLNNYLILPSN